MRNLVSVKQDKVTPIKEENVVRIRKAGRCIFFDSPSPLVSHVEAKHSISTHLPAPTPSSETSRWVFERYVSWPPDVASAATTSVWLTHLLRQTWPFDPVVRSYAAAFRLHVHTHARLYLRAHTHHKICPHLCLKQLEEIKSMRLVTVAKKQCPHPEEGALSGDRRHDTVVNIFWSKLTQSSITSW